MTHVFTGAPDTTEAKRPNAAMMMEARMAIAKVARAGRFGWEVLAREVMCNNSHTGLL
jgi:hypothetical protein